MSQEIESFTLRFPPLVAVFLSAATGIVADRLLSIPTVLFGVLSLLTLGCWWLACPTNKELFKTSLILISICGLYGARHHCDWYLFPSDELSLLATCSPTPTCVDAIVLGYPRRIRRSEDDPFLSIPRQETFRTAAIATRVLDGVTSRRASGRFDLYLSGETSVLTPGTKVRIFGKLSRPGPPRNPGEFDFSASARGRRRMATISVAHPECVTVLGYDRMTIASRWLDFIRLRSQQNLEKHIASEQLPLASAMILGEQNQLSHERRSSFMVTGTIHLLAISGLHVGILAAGMIFIWRLGFLPRNWSAISIILFVVAYTCLVGFRPPILRASLLITMCCVAKLIGREAISFNSLALAALIILAMDPSQLFETGAQLSFLAVAIIARFRAWFITRKIEDPIERLIARSRPIHLRTLYLICRTIKALVAFNAIVWLFTAPLIASTFHLVTPIAVGLNPILIVPVWIALFTGFLVVLVSPLVPVAAQLSGAVCSECLLFIERIVMGSADASFGFFWTSGPPVWWTIFFYLVLILSSLRPISSLPRRWWFALSLCWLMAGSLLGQFPKTAPSDFASHTQLSFASDTQEKPRAEPALTCLFIDVGHGTAVLLRLPNGQSILYDAGSFGSHRRASNAIANVLWNQGIDHLDGIFLSHADVDHYNALPGILDKFSIGVVYVSPVMFQQITPPLEHLISALKCKDVPIEFVAEGDMVHMTPNTFIKVLHPPPLGVQDSDNANSIVLLLESNRKKVLLTGDLEGQGMEQVIGRPQIDCDVTLAPHHGSRHSKPQQFLHWSSPQVLITSSGKQDEHVDSRTEHLYSFHTATDGAIMVKLSDHAIDVYTWLEKN